MNPTSRPGIAADLMDSDRLYEVIDGQRIEPPSSGAFASWVASQLTYHLGRFARTERLGIVVCQALFILDSVRDLCRRPDVAFISHERWSIDRVPAEEGDWEIIPDLA